MVFLFIGDIGGTNARFNLFDYDIKKNLSTLIKKENYLQGAYKSLSEIIDPWNLLDKAVKS